MYNRIVHVPSARIVLALRDRWDSFPHISWPSEQLFQITVVLYTLPGLVVVHNLAVATDIFHKVHTVGLGVII